jgi:hypothetical protein
MKTIEIPLYYDELAAQERGIILMDQSKLMIQGFKNSLLVGLRDIDAGTNGKFGYSRVKLPIMCTMKAHHECKLSYLSVQLEFRENPNIEIADIKPLENYSNLKVDVSGLAFGYLSWDFTNLHQSHVNNDFQLQLVLDYAQSLEQIRYDLTATAKFMIDGQQGDFEFTNMVEGNLFDFF